MIKAVIFDMDGVITDTEPFHVRAEKEVMARYGVTVTTEELQTYVGVTGEAMFSDLVKCHGLKQSPEQIHAEKRRRYAELTEKGVPAIPGVIDLITALKFVK